MSSSSSQTPVDAHPPSGEELKQQDPPTEVSNEVPATNGDSSEHPAEKVAETGEDKQQDTPTEVSTEVPAANGDSSEQPSEKITETGEPKQQDTPDVISTDVPAANGDSSEQPSEKITETDQVEVNTESGDAPQQPTEKPSKESLIEQMQEHYKAGRSLYLAENFSEASERLSLASQLGTTVYGELAPEMFNAYLYYGKTLVELRRAATSGNPVGGLGQVGAGGGEEDEKAGEPEEGAQEPADAGQKDLEGSDQVVGDQEEASEEEADAEEEQAAVDETLREEEPDNAAADPEDEGLAWEVLDVARVICEKQEQTPEWKLNKADVHCALGTALTVEEQFANARKEYETALEIQMELLKPHDRKLAETLFNIGLLFRSESEFTRAGDCFVEAGEVLKKKIEFLKNELASGNLSEEDAKLYASELEDVEQVAESIAAEALDARESAVTHQQKLDQLRAEREQLLKLSGQGALVDSSNAAADDITAMVRKRKQPPTEEPSDAKGTAENNGADGPKEGAAAEEADENDGTKKPRLEDTASA